MAGLTTALTPVQRIRTWPPRARNPLARAARDTEGANRIALLDRAWLRPLLICFVVKQLLLITLFAPFTGHDEVDHYWYIARLGSGDGLGVVGEVLLPAETRPWRGYVADYPTNAEVIQPPLYHALLAPIWRLTPGDAIDKLYVLRLYSVLLGTATVWIAYRTACLLFPESPFLRSGVPIFVAFQPQLAFEAAIVNHDVQVIFLFSLLVLLLLEGMQRGFSTGREVAIGLVTAAGLWTKVSFGLGIPVILLAIGWWWWDRRRCWGDRLWSLYWLGGSLFLTIGLPLLSMAPWFLRSFWLYGDPTGSQRLREIQEFDETASSYHDMVTSSGFWHERLTDFWSNYGWRNIPFDPLFDGTIWFVWAICGVCLLLLVLREVLARPLRLQRLVDRRQWRGLAVVTLSVLMLAYGVLYVGTIQFTQSRFIFPAMIGIAILSLLGIDRLLPARFRAGATPVLLGLLILLNVLSMVRFVIPFYYGPGGGGVLLP